MPTLHRSCLVPWGWPGTPSARERGLGNPTALPGVWQPSGGCPGGVILPETPPSASPQPRIPWDPGIPLVQASPPNLTIPLPQQPPPPASPHPQHPPTPSILSRCTGLSPDWGRAAWLSWPSWGTGRCGTLQQLKTKISMREVAGHVLGMRQLLGGRGSTVGVWGPQLSLCVFSSSPSTTTSTQRVTARARGGGWPCHTRRDFALACRTPSRAPSAVRLGGWGWGGPGAWEGQGWEMRARGGRGAVRRSTAFHQLRRSAVPSKAATGPVCAAAISSR